MLEGDRDDIESLMASIIRDPRHRDIVITETRTIATRHFKSWLLAYDGGSAYIEQTMLAALRGGDVAVAARPVLWLFEALTEAGGIDHGRKR